MHNLKTLASLSVLSLALAGVAVAAGTTASPAPAASPAAPAAAAKPAGPSDRAQIQALEKGLNAAFEAKNPKKVMSYYARQGLFVFDVTPPRQHVGWADYEKDWEDLFAAYPGPATNQITDLSITVVGDVAYGHNVQDGHFTAKDGSKIELVVRVTDVYRKIGGKWFIVQEHVSVPVDLATMKPDPLSKP
ncbi:MAG TPA: nuclear transport factor 2 family protein [Caulobacteraceae bacterium]|nr:nuclear transport factor 2 family protein [Caulobacteraceae bacterium]